MRRAALDIDKRIATHTFVTTLPNGVRAELDRHCSERASRGETFTTEAVWDWICGSGMYKLQYPSYADPHDSGVALVERRPHVDIPRMGVYAADPYGLDGKCKRYP